MCVFPKLQAHRGVSSEYPENTMKAFEAAIAQGYEYIELDPNYTLDREIVVLHDTTVNRTAGLSDPMIRISELTYLQTLSYDFGAPFSLRFKNERLPLLCDVLELCRSAGVTVKLDSKIERFPEDATKKLYALIRRFESGIALTSDKVDMILTYAALFPLAELHYDGAVDEEVLDTLAPLSDRLTIWLPYFSSKTSWVKIPFADKRLSALVKAVAKLGIWLVDDCSAFEKIVCDFEPDIIETSGIIKPVRSSALFADTHVHSEHSHDGKEKVSDIADLAIKNGLGAITVTDHCDIQYYTSRNMPATIAASVRDTAECAKQYASSLKVLTGIELGEALWDERAAKEILATHRYDAVIGSVHAVRYKQYTDPYSLIDFSAFSSRELYEYADRYFDELYSLLELDLCDTLAHLTCPFSYINGRFGRGLDVRQFDGKIEKILARMIEKSVALEVNTSRLGSAFAQLMPDDKIIKAYKKLGGYLITLGSDAHIASSVGNDFAKAAELLCSLGFENAYYFENRIAIPYTLKGNTK